jgi:hypothetical protein
VTRADFVLAAVAAPVVSPLPIPSALPTGSPSLAVYHARTEGANPPALTPDQLLFAKDVHVHVVDDAATISATRTAVDAARAHVLPNDVTIDARWGLRFTTATGRAVHSVYCDAACARGLIDGRAVTFENGSILATFLEDHFG